MRVARVRWLWFGLVLAAVACESERPEAPAQSPALVANAISSDDLALRLAPRLGYSRAVAKLDSTGERVLAGAFRPPLDESDQRPLFEVFSWDVRSDALVRVHEAAREATFSNAGVYVVDANDELLLMEGPRVQRLIDGVLGRPAPLAGAVVVARRGAEPGESDLWLVLAGGAPRTLAAAPGPDDFPIALPDGRVAFVSGRTTVASLWVVDPETNAATQLTNQGLVAGGPLPTHVPTPVRMISAEASQLTYDAGNGDVWRVALPSGQAARLGSAP